MFCSCHTHYVPAVHLRGRGPPPECRCHRGGGELCNTEAQPQGGRRAERWEDRRPPAPAVRSAGPTLTPALGPASLLCPWDSSGRILERVAIPFSRGSSRPGIESVSPASAGGFLTTAPPGKPAPDVQRRQSTKTSRCC